MYCSGPDVLPGLLHGCISLSPSVPPSPVSLPPHPFSLPLLLLGCVCVCAREGGRARALVGWSPIIGWGVGAQWVGRLPMVGAGGAMGDGVGALGHNWGAIGDGGGAWGRNWGAMGDGAGAWGRNGWGGGLGLDLPRSFLPACLWQPLDHPLSTLPGHGPALFCLVRTLRSVWLWAQGRA